MTIEGFFICDIFLVVSELCRDDGFFVSALNRICFFFCVLVSLVDSSNESAFLCGLFFFRFLVATPFSELFLLFELVARVSEELIVKSCVLFIFNPFSMLASSFSSSLNSLRLLIHPRVNASPSIEICCLAIPLS